MPSCIKLPAALVRGELGDLKLALLAGLEGGSPVEIDGGEVSRIDFAGAQLLFAFQREAARLPRAVAWTAVAAPLRAGLTALGMRAVVP
jgi:hypothetical protein